MKHINLFLMLCVLCIVVYGISACSKEENHKPDTDQSIPTPEPDPTPEPEPDNYTLQGTMQAAEQLVGKNYSEIHKYMRSYGWDYSEHPNSSDKDHNDGIHCEVVYDKSYNNMFLNLSFMPMQRYLMVIAENWKTVNVMK